VHQSHTHTHTHTHQQHPPPWKRKIMLPEEIWRLDWSSVLKFLHMGVWGKKIQLLQRSTTPKAKQYNKWGWWKNIVIKKKIINNPTRVFLFFNLVGFKSFAIFSKILAIFLQVYTFKATMQKFAHKIYIRKKKKMKKRCWKKLNSWIYWSNKLLLTYTQGASCLVPKFSSLWKKREKKKQDSYHIVHNLLSTS